MFGGDYFDWTKAENKEAIQFLKDMVDNSQTPIDQIADKYEQMNPKANDGKYGSWFMWGLGTDYEKQVCLEQIRFIWLWFRISVETERELFLQIPGVMC